MPTGETHDRVTYALMPAALLIGWAIFGLPLNLVAWWVVGLWLGGILLSPDLDTASRPYFRWGVLRWLWWPYQAAIRHRSVLSHGLIVGPAIRLLYLGFVLALGFYVVQLGVEAVHHAGALRWQLPLERLLEVLKRYQTETFCCLGGYWCGTGAHGLLDAVVSGWQNLLHGRTGAVLAPARRRRKRARHQALEAELPPDLIEEAAETPDPKAIRRARAAIAKVQKRRGKPG
jgi:uncharacterized metal-binding protein